MTKNILDKIELKMLHCYVMVDKEGTRCGGLCSTALLLIKLLLNVYVGVKYFLCLVRL